MAPTKPSIQQDPTRKERLGRTGSRRPDFPLHRILQLAFPGPPPGPPPSGTCLEHLPREVSRRHLIQIPEPLKLTPLDVEEQRLYSELLPDGRAPHPISKGVPSHPTEEAHFSHLYLGSRSFSHDPKFMPIGEGRKVDRPVNRELCFSPQLSLHHN
ncbi:hypothetical protein ILYODFUR_003579 [Ilyodon furcidens]|uniref:Uncharacterized protein n=1 Tax=Ilyodon furcidens TaxID=33524 RepID=A0ABV0U3J7_9TELE